MLNIYICEDNLEQRKRLKNIILDTIMIENLDMGITLDTDDPFKILEEIKSINSTALYFIDVDLKSSINGIQLAEKIREFDPRGFIVFVTTHAEMSYLTFLYKVEAIDYIIKDNHKNMRSRIFDCILNANQKYIALNNNTAHKIITIKSGDKNFSIDLNKILFFETSDIIHKVNLYTETRKIEFYSQMKDVINNLDERFIRCHRSYIINKDKIKYVDYTHRTVHMIDGSICYASVRGIKLLKSL